ncbi:MAG: FAD-dependent oxidoreductase [Gemmatimonadaceae bacterium]|nr:FAD-dependent oxidoreductase [Gemmatimonadaceae bacterium]
MIDINGLRCWPSEPRYDQLVDGERLRARVAAGDSHLEANAGGGTTAGAVTLQAGRDFDRVILGIPAMALSITEPLARQSVKWKHMLSGVETVATQAVQLWLQPSVEQMGWRPSPSADQVSRRAVLGAYAQPFHTWADFSHLAASEDWPDHLRPHAVAYFLGTIPHDAEDAAQATTVKGNSQYELRESVQWLSTYATALWPGLVREHGELAWDLLVDPEAALGAARMDAQYHRANTHGTERYVQHTAGTTKYRLKAHESGFENLVLAGDWTDTGICGGCVETATMSGLQASRAISGYPRTVIGESR